MSPVWHGSFGENAAVPLVTVAAGAAIAVFAARQREAAVRARGGAETERRQLELLADAARITDGAADIDEALRRLLALLVPAVADAAWVDVIDPDGSMRRLATRAHGPDRAEIEAWIMGRAADRSEASPTTRVLEGEGGRVAELTGALREAMIHDEEDRRHMDASGLRSTIALPLAPSGGPLGALGMAVGRSGRTYGDEELGFARLLVGRAGLALANAQLVHRLTSAQRRLDGILRSLAEAVTVQDRSGDIVYANQRAAVLLGLPDVDAVLTAEPGELVGSFEIQHPDGRPVAVDELPGARVLAGEDPPPLLTRSVFRATGELHWFLTKATLLVDAGGEELAVNVIEDVTEEQEAALRMRFLAEAGSVLGSSLDPEETLQRVAQLVVPRMADWCAIELPDEKGVLQQVALAHVDPALIETGRAMRERWPPQRDAPSSPYEVLRTGAAQLLAEVPDELLEAVVGDPEQLAAVRALGLNSAVTVPMIARDRTLGVMSFVFSESGRRYAERDLAFLQELAGRAATAIENARLYTERSQVARTLQDSLLPEQLPRRAGLALRRRVPGRAARRRGRRRLLRLVPGRGRAHGAARRRDRQGRPGGGADVARPLHGADRRGLRPHAVGGARARQPGAARAAAAGAGDDAGRAAARRRGAARRRRPSPAAAPPRRRRRRAGRPDRDAARRRARLRARRGRRGATGAGRGAAAVHRRGDRHAR